ncbi:hypothetical protein LTR56_000104 [Elasticomyces elasticus]|nr:hypothetical protein LTR56_000104 [Elasticomyces elasticus]KAK3667092.1 hypothetical protein LTR22_001956 [Elasticomyces elasticus]KAK4932867.1 hypothetical protein LTR49_000823 [Elasticomyces elasticus]KAK5768729.1 hypothetical protein LTS12_001155 [Elasticomyces elasticus]
MSRESQTQFDVRNFRVQQQVTLQHRLIKLRPHCNTMSRSVGSTEEKEAEDGEQIMECKKEEDICFPLMELPPEIWINICRLAAAHTKTIILDAEKLSPRMFQDMVMQPAITRVCHVIRNETLNAFHLTKFVYLDNICADDTSLWTWLGRVRASSPSQRLLHEVIIESKWNQGYFNTGLRGLGLTLAKVGKEEWRTCLKDWVAYRVVER